MYLSKDMIRAVICTLLQRGKNKLSISMPFMIFSKWRLICTMISIKHKKHLAKSGGWVGIFNNNMDTLSLSKIYSNCAPLLDNSLYIQVEQLKISTNQSDCCIKLRNQEFFNLFINENYFRRNTHQQETYSFP